MLQSQKDPQQQMPATRQAAAAAHQSKWASVSHTHMQIADEADSGWTTVKASRRRVRRQTESTAPASLDWVTASTAAPLLKPLPVLKASRASCYKARLPEAPQCSHDPQVRH